MDLGANKTIKATTLIIIILMLLSIALYSVYNVVDSRNRYTAALNANRIAVTNAINFTLKEAQNEAYLQGVIDGKNGKLHEDFSGIKFSLPLIKDTLISKFDSIK